MSGFRARCGAPAFSTGSDLPTVQAGWRTAALQGGQMVYLVEIGSTAYPVGLIGASSTVPFIGGRMARAASALSTALEIVSGGSPLVLRFSDSGYVSRSSDSIGAVPYGARIKKLPSIDRKLPLAPEDGTRVQASWGSFELSNSDGFFNGLYRSIAIAGRPLRVLFGTRTFDAARGIWVDPSYDSLQVVFAGVAAYWLLAGTVLQVVLRDALAPFDAPYQTRLYGGTGGADGGSDLTGKPLPRLRGSGTNLTPVLLDAANHVYQVSDGPVTFSQILEQQAAVFTFNGDYPTYAALIAAALGSGQYATCVVLGLFRLAAPPAGYTITCDAVGAFPSGTVYTTPGAMALAVLREELGYASTAINLGSFASIDAQAPYATFVYYPDAVSIIDVFSELLIGVGASIGTDRQGRPTCYRLAPPTGSPLASFDTRQIIGPPQWQALPQSVQQPNTSRAVRYGRNYTVQTDTPLGTATDARVAWSRDEYRVSNSWVSAAMALAFPSSPVPDPVATQLLNAADAAAQAASWGALWGQPRSLVTVPMRTQAYTVDLGAEVFVTYPAGDFAGGRSGIVVGETVDSSTNHASLLVLA